MYNDGMFMLIYNVTFILFLCNDFVMSDITL